MKVSIDLQTINIVLPKNFDNTNITEQQIVEWLKFNFGKIGGIDITNPLNDVELSECKNNISFVLIDNKSFII